MVYNDVTERLPFLWLTLKIRKIMSADDKSGIVYVRSHVEIFPLMSTKNRRSRLHVSIDDKHVVKYCDFLKGTVKE